MAGGARVHRLSEELPARRVDALLAPIQRFARLEAAGGLVLLACAGAALVWANTAWGGSYHHLFHETELLIGFEGKGISRTLEWWINDALMAVFFFLVGLEIKREILVGELSSLRKAALPMMAAFGGMVVPAAVFWSINGGTPGGRGWGVPMATDIAFALGVLALLGRRVPLGLRVFLATLAIADDLGALVVIAVFYTEQLHLPSLFIGLLCTLFTATLGAMGLRHALVYLLIGTAAWWFIHESGVHATIAGVLGALAVPVRSRVDTGMFLRFTERRLEEFRESGPSGDSIVTDGRQQALVQAIEDGANRVQTPLQQFEHMLVPWVAFLIVPVFALANAGVRLQGGIEGEPEVRVALGVALGLLLGKPIGIFAATWLAVKLGLGELPAGVRWGHIHGVAWLAGIGFTMALFIANLAYGSHPELLTAAKIGVLAGSALAAVVGLALLLWASRRAPE